MMLIINMTFLSAVVISQVFAMVLAAALSPYISLFLVMLKLIHLEDFLLIWIMSLVVRILQYTRFLTQSVTAHKAQLKVHKLIY